MSLKTAWRSRLLPVPGLPASWEVLPPKSILLGGTERRAGRELTREEAETLAGRGVPVLVVSFDGSGMLAAGDLPRLLEEHARHFRKGEAAAPEAVLRIFGRREADHGDQRVVVAVFTA